MTREPLHFDRIARAYRWLEYLSFGRELERCRFTFVNDVSSAKKILALGDGDGRFLAKLLVINREATADAFDVSAKMLALLNQRAQSAGAKERVRCQRMDIRDFEPSETVYDLVVTHFFLDCLTEKEITALLERLQPQLTNECRWLVSEFAIAPVGLRRVLGKFVVKGLYLAFGWMTGLPVRRLPEYAEIFERAGFGRENRREFRGGLLYSEIWRRTTEHK